MTTATVGPFTFEIPVEPGPQGEPGPKGDTGPAGMGASTPGGRLTIVSGQPEMEQNADYSSPVLFYAPYMSSKIPIFDGVSWAAPEFSGSLDPVGLTLAGGAKWAANTPRDVFVIMGETSPILATGPAWPAPNTTARKLIRRDGLWVNSEPMTLDTSATDSVSVDAYRATFIGSINPATTGTLTATFTSGKNRRCDVWSAYNQVDIVLSAGCPQASPTLPVVWSPTNQYLTAGFVAFNNDTNNAGSWFTGLPQHIDAEYSQWTFVNTAAVGGGNPCAAIITICENAITSPTKWASLSSDQIASAGDGRMKSGTILSVANTFKSRVGAGKAIMGCANANTSLGITMIGLDPRTAWGTLTRGHELQIRYMA